MGMALVYDAHGQPQDAARHMELADQWLRLSNLRYTAAADAQ